MQSAQLPGLSFVVNSAFSHDYSFEFHAKQKIRVKLEKLQKRDTSSLILGDIF